MSRQYRAWVLRSYRAIYQPFCPFRGCVESYGLSFFDFFFSSRRRHTRCGRDWSSDVCSSDLQEFLADLAERTRNAGRLNIDLSLSEKDVQFLNDFVAELEVSRQEAMREAERAAQKIREEDRRFLDDFVAELNTTRLSAGQDLSPELTVFIDQLREAEQLTEQFRTEAERNAETWRRAQEFFAEGLISEETLNRVRDSIERMDQSFKDMGQSLGRGLRDSLVDAMTGIEVRWDDMLRRMIANAALDQLFNLLGTLGGPVGGVARFLGFGGARAAGGPVYPGRAYLVGERGPEIITPKAMGTVIP